MTATGNTVTINFDDLPAGTVVTNQYPEVVISGDPSFPNQVIASTDASQPNSIGAPTPGDSVGNPYNHPLYLNFTNPVSNLTFKHIRNDAPVGTAIAQVKVYTSGGGLSGTVDILSTGSLGLVDLTGFTNISRIEVVNITDPAGILYDDFQFTVSGFDIDKFIAEYKASIGSLSSGQEAAVRQLLTRMHSDPNINLTQDVRQAAYILATVRRETGSTYLPVEEGFGKLSQAFFERKYGYQTKKGKELGNTAPGDGYRYRGRGFVQITGKANYAKYGLEANPDQAMDPAIAYNILSDGMFNGKFTGKKLSDYIVGSNADYVGARRIVNGTDKARLIAGYAVQFESIFRKSIVGSV